MRVIARDRDERSKEFRVYCLSKRSDILTMWENYADNHRGYCLEFANKGPFFGSTKEVIYGDTTEMDLSNPEHFKSWCIYCKRQDYSFEEEVRVHCRRTFPQFAPIDPHHLTRIILGEQMSEAHQKQILEVAKRRDPQLTVVCPREAFFIGWAPTIGPLSNHSVDIANTKIAPSGRCARIMSF